MPISHLLSASFYQSPTEEEDQSNIKELNENDAYNQNPKNQSLDDGMNYNYGYNQSEPYTYNNTQTEEKVLLIDTDAGIDDAWALFMALSAQRNSSRIKVVGITCVYGTTSVTNACRNVLSILDAVHEKTVPVFKGVGTPMISTPESWKNNSIQGHDGFEGAKLPPVQSIHEKTNAVNAIIRLTEMYKGRLSIVCLGPLTNIAMALKLKPEISQSIKELYIMGGNTEGVGNVTACSEFNFHLDPEAANVVLESFPYCPIYLLPYETCLKSTSAYSWRLNSFANIHTQKMDLLNRIETRLLDKYRDGWSAHDALLISCILNAQVMKKTENYHCSVELHGNITRGLMVVDRNFRMKKPANVTVIEEVDREICEKMLIWAAGGPAY